MTERERLIEILKEDPCDKLMSDKGGCQGCPYEHLGIEECFAERYADLLLTNGVIVPPCKIGDKVYQTDGVRMYKSTIQEITHISFYTTKNIDFDERAIGKTVFLTKEDAEKALVEREKQ